MNTGFDAAPRHPDEHRLRHPSILSAPERRYYRELLLCLLVMFLLTIVSAVDCHAACTDACHRSFKKYQFPHEPVKADCFNCHEQKEPGHPYPIKAFRLKKPEPELCYDCHDRFGTKKVIHGILKEGKCTACHRVHGSNAAHLLPETDGKPFCFGCHDQKEFTGSFVHGPAAVAECYRCHLPHESDNKALLKAKVPDLCYSCHADFGAAIAKSHVLHKPVREDACFSCHLPHSSHAKYLLKNDPPNLCLDCHSNMKKVIQTQYGHQPVTQGKGCNNCHSSHYSEAKSLLPLPEKELCLSCHGASKTIAGRRGNIAKEIDKKPVLHGPIGGGSCAACHAPHGSGNPKLLIGRYPAAFYDSYADGEYAFCLGCHEKLMLQFPDTTIYTSFRNGNRNLHYTHVAIKQKGRTCRACHEPHGSNLPKLVSSDGPNFGEWKIPINFVATEDGGRCAPGCHWPYAYSRTSPVSYSRLTTARVPAAPFVNASTHRTK